MRRTLSTACSYDRVRRKSRVLDIPADAELTSDDGRLSASGTLVVRTQLSLRDEVEEGVEGRMVIDDIDAGLREDLFQASSLVDEGQTLFLASEMHPVGMPASLRLTVLAEGSDDPLTAILLAP